MKQNYNARNGLLLCMYGEFAMIGGILTCIEGLVGMIFSLFTLAAFVCRAQGMKKAVLDNRDYMRASRLLMVGIALNAGLFVVSVYQQKYIYAGMLVEMNAVLNVLSNYMIIRSTMDMLEYNGRTELCDKGKNAWTLYWVLYTVYLVCQLSRIFVYFIGEPVVIVLKVVGGLIAAFASYNYIRWLKRVQPIM